jgi:hypothetical protein
MALSHQDLREALAEFERLALEGQVEGWDDNPGGEKVALTAARRVLAELDSYLVDRLAELDEPA